jgi:hypothetical protein
VRPHPDAGGEPGRIVAEFTVELAQPRNRLAPRFRALVDDIYARMTERPREPAKALAQISYRMSHVSPIRSLA